MVPSALYLPTLTSHPHVPWQQRVLHPKIRLKKDFKGLCLQKAPPSHATAAHGRLTPQLSFDGDSAS